MKALLSYKDVAGILVCSVRHVLRLRHTGRLRGLQDGRWVRFEQDEVERYKKAHQDAPPAVETLLRETIRAAGRRA